MCLRRLKVIIFGEEVGYYFGQLPTTVVYPVVSNKMHPPGTTKQRTVKAKWHSACHPFLNTGHFCSWRAFRPRFAKRPVPGIVLK